MNIFLPSIRITKKVESTCNRFYKSILGLNKNINADKMNLLLGRGCFENKLMPRLVKVIRKYQKHFQAFPSYYLSIWNQFWEWIGWSNNKEKVNLKKIVNEKSLTSLANFHNIKIGKD